MNATKLLFQAQKALGRDDPAGAAELLSRAADLAPDSPHVALHRALALADSGRLDEALEIFRDARQRWPGNPVFPLFLGVLLLEAGRLDEAAAALEAARAISPGNRLALASLALVAMKRGEVETPLQELAAAGFTDNPRVLAAIMVEVEAQLFRRFGTDTDPTPPAAQDDEASERLERSSAPRLLELGRRRLDRGDPAGAWPLLLAAARKNPSLPDLFACLGFAAFDLGKLDLAIEYLDRAGNWASMPEAVALHRGAALYRLGRFDEALPSLREAIEKDTLGDFSGWARLYLARTLVALGRAEEAHAPLRQLLASEGDLALARLRQAMELLGLAIPETAPKGFRVVQEGAATIVAREGYLEALTNPTELPPLETAGGRAPLRRIALPDGVAVVRRSVRGGLLGPILGESSLDGGRFLREICLSEALRRRGIPTPEMIGGIRWRRFPGLFRWEIATREVEGARDLAEALGQAADEVAAHEHLARAARLLRRFHDAGFVHHDLNARNIIFDREKRAMIVDLDRAELLPNAPQRLRLGNLARLYRSLHKLGLAPRPVSDRAWLEFFAAYSEGDAGLSALADHLMRLCRRQVAVHSRLWRSRGERG